MGTLYVVATPIGNLQDITLRALQVLREVKLIAAEDTRTTRKLLAHYDIHTALTSYHDFSGPGKRQRLLEALAAGDVALVSEAGMPGISDPGYDLIREAIAAGYPVAPIPGPSALIAALAVSGLPTDRFLYLGFLPRRQAERKRILAQVSHLPWTLVAFEAPHRIREALRDALEALGDRPVAIARELTKVFEEIWRGRLSEAITHFEEAVPRGEFTLVIAGAEEGTAGTWDEAKVRGALVKERAAGKGAREAVKAVVALSGWSRRDVYRLWVELDSHQGAEDAL